MFWVLLGTLDGMMLKVGFSHWMLQTTFLWYVLHQYMLLLWCHLINWRLSPRQLLATILDFLILFKPIWWFNLIIIRSLTISPCLPIATILCPPCDLSGVAAAPHGTECGTLLLQTLSLHLLLLHRFPWQGLFDHIVSLLSLHFQSHLTFLLLLYLRLFLKVE